MKSPADLRTVLKRQWENGSLRESRLLGADSAWPVVLSIGRPTATRIRSDLDAVRRHIDTWRSERIGKVVWEPVSYRDATEPVNVPVQWRIGRPSEWIAACGDTTVRREFDGLAELVKQIDPMFHSLLVRRHSLWRGKPAAEVEQAARLALAIEPGCAAGKPLRTLSIAGIDTKFFQRNAHLVTTMLDARFDGEVSRIGLETFLGADAEGEHWLLVIDLDGSLLPFQKQRVRGSELQDSALPGQRLLIVENETCQHQLPGIPDTIAVLGAGFDLSWTRAEWLKAKRVAYWGDIDTWGLQFLGKARQSISKLDALMMTAEVYQRYIDAAVPEPVNAGTNVPAGLNQSERDLYQRLLSEPRGRLEQEFLPETLIQHTVLEWAGIPTGD